ncbi:PREDICTED: uncharacterized protein LOC106148023 [Chinchilla lanigera]|uniref:uncharacterized protein LOC106148023 n=1 Tax=Chinchilla lanigera TaxID=34839 RepID=UPI000697B3B5|nr:PREDICTED: uncharacterized protein LOC106148023 [Chinchilla lanigera]
MLSGTRVSSLSSCTAINALPHGARWLQKFQPFHFYSSWKEKGAHAGQCTLVRRLELGNDSALEREEHRCRSGDGRQSRPLSALGSSTRGSSLRVARRDGPLVTDVSVRSSRFVFTPGAVEWTRAGQRACPRRLRPGSRVPLSQREPGVGAHSGGCVGPDWTDGGAVPAGCEQSPRKHRAPRGARREMQRQRRQYLEPPLRPG